MANVCYFEMRIKGDEENIKTFVKEVPATLYEGFNYETGKSYVINHEFDEYDGKDEPYHTVGITGECKWSMRYSFLDTMSPDIEELCARYNVNIEAFSEEEANSFQEHLKYENGKSSYEARNVQYEYEKDETGEDTLKVIAEHGGFKDNNPEFFDFDTLEDIIPVKEEMEME